MSKPRMLTGDRPTGKFHLGHYVGTMKNRVKLQHEYECFFLIADLHMLTTKHLPEHIRETDAHARELILDAIAAGVEPEHVTFYLQSGVHEISEIYTLVQNLVTVSRLERMPSLKDMARDANIEMPFGLLGYPVLQAADILCVKANVVPVGKDNVAHVEVTREIARQEVGGIDLAVEPMHVTPSQAFEETVFGQDAHVFGDVGMINPARLQIQHLRREEPD